VAAEVWSGIKANFLAKGRQATATGFSWRNKPDTCFGSYVGGPLEKPVFDGLQSTKAFDYNQLSYSDETSNW